MLVHTTRAALALALGPACSPEPTAPEHKGGMVPVRTDPEKAMLDARKRNAGMMIYFTSKG